VTIPTDLTFYLELSLEVLLAFTLVYCVILERRLATVRKGQEGLSRTIGELNMAIAGAGASLRALKAAAGESARSHGRYPLDTLNAPIRKSATPAPPRRVLRRPITGPPLSRFLSTDRRSAACARPGRASIRARSPWGLWRPEPQCAGR